VKWTGVEPFDAVASEVIGVLYMRPFSSAIGLVVVRATSNVPRVVVVVICRFNSSMRA
jgi:hypothetical protein